MKVVWNIVDSNLLKTTLPRTKERKLIVESIVKKLIVDPDFANRLNTQDPDGTISQHIVAWIGYLEGRKERPPLIR
ncbi:hypothetical protein D3C75_1188240 [compost metagenome]